MTGVNRGSPVFPWPRHLPLTGIALHLSGSYAQSFLGIIFLSFFLSFFHRASPLTARTRRSTGRRLPWAS